MRRITLAIAGSLACAALVFSSGTVAKSSPKTCTTMSENVIGHTVKGTLSASNVDSVQAHFATCAQAKKVMKRSPICGSRSQGAWRLSTAGRS